MNRTWLVKIERPGKLALVMLVKAESATAALADPRVVEHLPSDDVTVSEVEVPRTERTPRITLPPELRVFMGILEAHAASFRLPEPTDFWPRVAQMAGEHAELVRERSWAANHPRRHWWEPLQSMPRAKPRKGGAP